MADDETLNPIINIGILNIGSECNQNCRQCFYNTRTETQKELSEELVLVNKIKTNNEKYRNANFTIYPKEITTTPGIIKEMGDNGQKYVLTNGKTIEQDPSILRLLKENNIHKIKVTLFPNKQEQLFWNRNTASEYNKIRKGIRRAIGEGIEVETFTMLTPQNMSYYPSFYEELRDMKVTKSSLLRFTPTGNGQGMDLKYIINKRHLEELLSMTDGLKKGLGPRISYGTGFGPNFYGNAIYKFIQGTKQVDGMIASYPCPSINNSFLGISLKEKGVYRCFKLISDPKAKIGNINDNGEINLDANLKFDKSTLKEKLRGMCAKDACDFQSLCLGGCRAQAYAIAKIKGEKNPEYAGQDICITNIIQHQKKKIQT